MSYRPKTAVLTSAILFTAYCTRTAISVFSHFLHCLTAVCLLFSIKTNNNNNNTVSKIVAKISTGETHGFDDVSLMHH